MDVYQHQREFRLKLLSLKLDPLFNACVGNVVLPQYFDADDEQDVAKAIDQYKIAYRKIPREADDLVELCHSDEAKDLVYDVYEALEHSDLTMAKDVAVQWAKEQAAKIAVLDSVDDIKRGDLAQVIVRMEEALRVGEDLHSPGIDVVRDTEHWLYEQWIDKVPTGLPHVDIHLDGGLGIGELGFVLAPTNRGKSTALMNLAYGAAGLMSKRNVVVFTHEMNPKVYAKRFGARLVFRFPSRGEDLSQYEEDLIETARLLMPGKVRIIGGRKMTMQEIEYDLNMLVDEGFKPGLMIDDYVDLIIPTRRQERRHELTEISEWLRDLGNEDRFAFPVWTASQVGRDAYTKEIITEAHIAEDIGKANTADVIFALCQTDEELKKERCRLYFAKIRDGKRGAMFDAKLYTDAQALITIGITKRREMEDA